MKHFILILSIISITIIALVGSFYIYQYRQKKTHLPEHIKKNQNIEKTNKNIEFYDLNTKTITLNSFIGKTVMINFWATWCAPCVEELPSLNQLAKLYPKELIILAVSNEKTDDIKNFLMAFPNFNTNFIFANMNKKNMLAHFSVRAFPETYILNKKGQLVQKVIGPQKWNSKDWKKTIKNLISID